MQQSSFYSPPSSSKKRRRDAEPSAATISRSPDSKVASPPSLAHNVPTQATLTRRRVSASQADSPSPSQASARKDRASSKSSPASTASSAVSPDKFKIHFASKVYRPLAHTSSKTARKSYTKEGNWLGEPDERIGESKTVVRCACRKSDITLDMLQCKKCLTWQHTACLSSEEILIEPHDHACMLCLPSGIEKKHESATAARLAEQAAARSRQLTPPPSLRRNAMNTARDEAQAIALSDSDSDSDDDLHIEQSPFTSPSAARPLKTLSANNASPLDARRAFLAASSSISPLLKATSSHPLLTPTKRKAHTKADALASSAINDQDEVFRATGGPPSLSDAETEAMDPLHIPLPPHYARLLQTHLGVERALLLHLATDGSRASAAMLKASNESSHLGDGEEMIIDLPALLPFSALQRTVERGSNHRFGPTELAQLVWLWEGGLDGKHANEEKQGQRSALLQRRGGMSLSVTTAKELNKVSRRSTSTWALGIELQIRHNAPVPEYEMIDPTSSPKTVPSSPSSSSGTPSKRFKRSGLSVMPLWSSKAAFRKEEVRRRLGQCVLKAHSDFLARPQADGAAAFKSTTSDHRGPFAIGFPLDALPPIPAASLPILDVTSSSVSKRPSSTAKHTVASVDADVTRGDDKATHERTLQHLLSSTKPKVDLQPAKVRAGSLLDRIKAKESAKALSSGIAEVSSETRPRAKTSAALMSLEQASARAKQKERSSRTPAS